MATQSKMPGRHRNGQSLVEFALGSMLLVVLLAGAIDLGRAIYTWVVVENMAGEAAAYLANKPDNDYTIDRSTPDDTFQGRARNVAARTNMGAIISPYKVAYTDVTVDVAQADRCTGTRFTVSVDYYLDDLFFPGLLGFHSVTINGTTQGAFLTQSTAGSCPTPTPVGGS